MGPTSHRIALLSILLVTRTLQSLDPCGHQYLPAGRWILAVIDRIIIIIVVRSNRS